MGISRGGDNPHIPEAYKFVWRDLRDLKEVPDEQYFRQGSYEQIPEDHREALISVFDLIGDKDTLTFGEINSALDHKPDVLKDAIETASFSRVVCYADDGYKLCSI